MRRTRPFFDLHFDLSHLKDGRFRQYIRYKNVQICLYDYGSSLHLDVNTYIILITLNKKRKMCNLNDTNIINK